MTVLYRCRRLSTGPSPDLGGPSSPPGPGPGPSNSHQTAGYTVGEEVTNTASLSQPGDLDLTP